MSPASTFNPRANNFDLLRLLAATQVMLVHMLDHLKLDIGGWATLLNHIPGVPVFFVISGFLISASYERAPSLKNYARNRLLRIYPALWVCLLLSVLVIVFIAKVDFSAGDMGLWLAAQATVVQFYNPDFLRGFGVGVINGSLWTISVELQFYVVLPLFYWLTKRVVHWRDAVLLVALITGAVVNWKIYRLIETSEKNIYLKLAEILLPMHVYLFIAGMLLQRNYQKISRWLQGKAWVWVLGYAAVIAAVDRFGGMTTGNKIHPLIGLVLAGLVISLANTRPQLSRHLHGDISYGVYIYHMLVINVLVQWQLAGNGIAAALGVAAVYVLAVLSWLFVEKPALARKKTTMHAVAVV